MNNVKWSQVYSVGVEEIDNQHRRFIEIINGFYEQLNSKNPMAGKTLLLNLMEYIPIHFQTEEKYFKQFKYSDADVHIEQHRNLEAKIAEFVRICQTEKMFNTSKAMDFLKSWIINHILISDKKYMRCFKENGLK